MSHAFQTSSPQMSSWRYTESHKHKHPSVADSLSLTNRMAVLPYPIQEAEVINSRCFSNMFRIKPCSYFLIKVYSFLVTTGEINCKNTTAVLGATPPKWVTVICTETGKPPDVTGCRLGATNSWAALLVHNPHKCHCLKRAFGLYWQPQGPVEVTPSVPHPLLPYFCLRCFLTSSLHLPLVGRKRNSDKK